MLPECESESFAGQEFGITQDTTRQNGSTLKTMRIVIILLAQLGVTTLPGQHGL